MVDRILMHAFSKAWLNQYIINKQATARCYGGCHPLEDRGERGLGGFALAAFRPWGEKGRGRGGRLRRQMEEDDYDEDGGGEASMAPAIDPTAPPPTAPAPADEDYDEDGGGCAARPRGRTAWSGSGVGRQRVRERPRSSSRRLAPTVELPQVAPGIFKFSAIFSSDVRKVAKNKAATKAVGKRPPPPAAPASAR